MFVGAKQVSTSTTAAVSRATKMMASWILALAFACLIQPATGFVGNPGLRSRETWRRASCDHPSSKGRPARRVVAAGVGGLRAAFEVDEGRELDVGSVLVAGSDNYGHMTFKAVALIYEHGEGGPTRAVCVDKGLDFTIGEMSSGDLGPLANNRLFRGGEDGGEVAIMIHPHDIEGARPLGDTGLFVGGFVSALDMVDEKRAEPGDFKFFFNHLAWPAGALKEQVEKGLWKVVGLPNDVLLETKRMRDMELWGRIEFALKNKVQR